ncbi:MerR family transcriptional regulator [Microbacterium sp. EYE_512]|uniref:MerR family transcriptional regulator n=2 Tax=Microbacteriaceae TaxID=85023 RepID=A0ABX5T0E2_9MICO|nr:MerR family transcriptional regulator [Microbacterium sp. EYE_512]QBR90534.1 MerR family transcriptional regulator [Microbacterium wangchenii]TXK16186.1 MerR family transcriptional regulator [Microbacterium wangchenii]
MHIGELAERTGLSLRTLRHYDEIGLLTPSDRTDGGFRLYTAADESRLLLIRRMKPLGYSLEQMGELLVVIDGLEADPADALLQERLDTIKEEALERRDRLRKQLAAAEEFVDQLHARQASPY